MPERMSKITQTELCVCVFMKFYMSVCMCVCVCVRVCAYVWDQFSDKKIYKSLKFAKKHNVLCKCKTRL